MAGPITNPDLIQRLEQQSQGQLPQPANDGGPPAAPAGMELVPLTGPNPKTQADADKAKSDAELQRLQLIQKRRELGLNDDGTPKTGIESALVGTDFLKTLPGEDARMAKAIAEGRVDIPRGKAATDPNWQRWINQAMQYDPQLDQANVFSRRATRREFTSGSYSKNITAINTALGHLDTLAQAADALNNFQHLGPATGLANRLRFTYLTESGDKRTANFNMARDAVANELMRVFRQVGASTTEIQDWKQTISAAQSPDQLHASIQQAADLLGSRLQALDSTYKQGMGASSDVFELLSPHAKEIFSRYGYGAPPDTDSGGAPNGAPNGGGGPEAGSPTEVVFKDSPESMALPPGAVEFQKAFQSAFLSNEIQPSAESIKAWTEKYNQAHNTQFSASDSELEQAAEGMKKGVIPYIATPQFEKQDITDARGQGGDAETADAFVRNAANTATAGLANVASAAADAALTDRSFASSMARENEIDKYDWQHHAIASTAGTVAGAVLIPTGVTGAARSAARAALRAGATREAAVAAARKAAAARLAAEGGAYGGVHGAATNNGTLLDRVGQSAVEAVTGAATGASLPYVAQLGGATGRGVKSVLSRSPNLAGRIIAKAIRADGNTAEDLARQAGNAADSGVPFMIGDSGDNVRGLLAASARAPGSGRTVAIEKLDDRQAGLADRVISHIERDLGPVANPHKVADELMSQASEAAGPLYDQAYSAPGVDAFVGKIQPLLNRPSMKKALGNAYRLAQEEGRDPESLGFDLDDAGNVVLRKVPSWQTLDYVKRGMDDVVESYRDKTTGKLVLDTEGKAINSTLRQYLSAFDKANPAYAAARAAYGGPVRGIDAMNRGRRALNMTADELEAEMRDMTTFEKEMFALGTRRAMAELVDSKGDTANVVHALVGTGKKRAMLARLFGDRKGFEQFVNTLDIENEAHQTFKRARTGSPTAPNQQDDAALAVATGVMDLMTSGAPIISSLRIASRAKAGAQAKKAQDAIASMLGETDPAKVRALIQRFKKEEARLMATKRKTMNVTRVGAVKAVPNDDNED